MTDDPLLNSISGSFIESAARDGFNEVEASSLQRLNQIRKNYAAHYLHSSVTAKSLLCSHVIP